MSAASRRLGAPRPTSVKADGRGRPRVVAGAPVEAVREEWLVEDRWWSDRPLRRHYLELVLSDGRDVVVFHDLEDRHWYVQRA